MFQAESVTLLLPRRIWLHFLWTVSLGIWSLPWAFSKLHKSCTLAFCLYVKCFSPLLILVVVTDLPTVCHVFQYWVAQKKGTVLQQWSQKWMQREVIAFFNVLLLSVQLSFFTARTRCWLMFTSLSSEVFTVKLLSVQLFHSLNCVCFCWGAWKLISSARGRWSHWRSQHKGREHLFCAGRQRELGLLHLEERRL